MNPIDPSKLSLDYLLENKVITILSWDDVIEHGTNWDEVELEEITRCHKDYMCYRDDMGYPDDMRDYSGVFSGVLYETWDDLNIDYYMHYKDGLRDGTEVHFYDSGKVDNYRFWKNSRLVGKVFGWYENGKIK
ncbi:MAG: hypothetical protein J6P20_10620, partial [Oscillospiraceae bacterium]|nr:hypothetical protein [Oscillospiraceae bacterium]